MSVGGQVVKSYGYDAAGRTTSVVSSAGLTTLTYDFEGRATSIVGPGIFQTNVFNGLDTRVGSTTNSVTRTFLRDGAYVTDPVLRDGAAIYTPGVSERRGAVTTFLHSGLKNADAQSSPTGLTATRAYDAFGNVLSSSGSWQGPFGYAGAFGYQEDATGLMLLGHRLYDPSTGRFLTRDPIKDGRNWYVYCGNDPLVFFDSDGLKRQRRPLRQWLRDQWDGFKGFFLGPGGDVVGGVVEGHDMFKAAGMMRVVPVVGAVSDIHEHGYGSWDRLIDIRESKPLSWGALSPIDGPRRGPPGRPPLKPMDPINVRAFLFGGHVP